MLSEEEFRNLALLARLDPNDESLVEMRTDFNRILDYVNKIEEVDTSSITDAYIKSDTRNIIRPDKPQDPLGPVEISKFAPKWEAGHFVVPVVIDAE